MAHEVTAMVGTAKRFEPLRKQHNNTSLNSQQLVDGKAQAI